MLLILMIDDFIFFLEFWVVRTSMKSFTFATYVFPDPQGN